MHVCICKLELSSTTANQSTEGRCMSCAFTTGPQGECLSTKTPCTCESDRAARAAQGTRSTRYASTRAPRTHHYPSGAASQDHYAQRDPEYRRLERTIRSWFRFDSYGGKHMATPHNQWQKGPRIGCESPNCSTMRRQLTTTNSSYNTWAVAET